MIGSVFLDANLNIRYAFHDCSINKLGNYLGELSYALNIGKNTFNIAEDLYYI